ncbi:2,5-dichloro-2,5-cyclohexadiene-1,4-diol dehydrogenase [Tsuneonella dongtanensis]|uniref:2,5-dichloro-2,5-cyclohexadiene-1,4-diol dehydrogenase n=1 Tax=Tsuneonella dongtanensis TaxID=692370 RepID=A0A1B2ADD4_9SPHN|nr:SDR family NAD(P)-dependent oxidoreductase [Tsuneonella dongtanensis]ANY20172.1 2,5-dichloro-2,5-cyclohexadiene-1,4-diol dehydrogenase [Tsuneonella dongtanensis]
MRFSGKTVVVTGAASGIGAETARLFAREGAVVFAADIDGAGVERLVSEGAGDIRFQQCDVCSTDDIKALMDRAAAETGGIDVVFNNAGAGGARAKIHEIEPDEWDRTMDLLLRSVAFGIRYAVPHMIGRQGAAIVNTASVAATGSGYSPTAYAVAKCGVLHLSKVAAADLAQFGIRVNAILPGFINTNIFTASLEVPDDTKAIAKAMIAQASANAQPVRRGGQPRDIAEACAYLASEAASFVNGTGLLVDGGLTIGQRPSWDPEAPSPLAALMALEEQARAGSPS